MEVRIMISVDDLLASAPELLLELWAKLEVHVGMTRETAQTLESMLKRGETAQEMAERLGISLELAHTRRARNGRAVLTSLMEMEEYAFVFKEVFSGETAS